MPVTPPLHVLALETATERAGVALAAPTGRYLAESRLPSAPSRLIYRWVEAVLELGRLRLADVDAIAFGAGPGSFTGARVAAAAALALGYGSGRPLLQVSTLAALAIAAMDHARRTEALVALDARMGGVYVGHYRSDGRGVIRALAPDRLEPADQSLPPPQDPARVVVAGSGFAAYPGLLAGWSPGFVARPDLLPSAIDVLAVLERSPGLAMAATPLAASPNYLRDRVTR